MKHLSKGVPKRWSRMKTCKCGVDFYGHTKTKCETCSSSGRKASYQLRKKFFFAVPSYFPVWPYKSRLAIGMNLDDFKAQKAPYYRFKVKGKMYIISKEKANSLGQRYKMPQGKLPNIIPLEEFEVEK